MNEANAEIRKALLEIPWFQELSPANLEKLISIAHFVDARKDQLILREGDPQDYLYILVDGRVATEIHVPGRGQTRVFTIQPPDILGWSSVTPGVRQRTASARALTDSRLIAFGADELRRLCDEDYELGYVVMRRLANVIASRLQVTRLQLLDVFAHPSREEGI